MVTLPIPVAIMLFSHKILVHSYFSNLQKVPIESQIPKTLPEYVIE